MYLTTAAKAQRLNVSVRTLQRMATRGHVLFIRFGPRTVPERIARAAAELERKIEGKRGKKVVNFGSFVAKS